MDIQKVPGVSERPETGPMQFGDDWPGVFIRGDNALAYSFSLAAILEMVPKDHWHIVSHLRGLLSDLRSCSVGNTGWPPVTEAKK